MFDEQECRLRPSFWQEAATTKQYCVRGCLKGFEISRCGHANFKHICKLKSLASTGDGEIKGQTGFDPSQF